MAEGSIAARVRGLVERVHGGSVNAAAKDAAVPQRTLARLVSGEVESPRADVLQKLASYYGASLEWLMTGDGDGPRMDESSKGEFLRHSLRLRSALRELPIPSVTYENLVLASQTMTEAWLALRHTLTGVANAPANFGRVMALEQELWAEWLELALIEQDTKAVAGWLNSNAALLAQPAAAFATLAQGRHQRTTASQQREAEHPAGREASPSLSNRQPKTRRKAR